MYGWRAKIGLIVPSTNTTIEMDFHRLVPDGISVHSERLLFSGHASVSSVDDQTRDMERASEFLASAKVDVIVCGVTAPTFYRGAGWDRQVAQIIEKKTHIPAITTSTAMIEGLKEMNMNRVCVVSSYPEDLEEKLLTFLTENGFSVARSSSFKLGNVWEIARIPGYSIYRMARDSFVPDADGIFIPVTQLGSLEIVEQLERDVGRPVVAANQASMWYALRKLGLPDRIDGFGELLRRNTRGL